MSHTVVCIHDEIQEKKINKKKIVTIDMLDFAKIK